MPGKPESDDDPPSPIAYYVTRRRVESLLGDPKILQRFVDRLSPSQMKALVQLLEEDPNLKARFPLLLEE